MPKRRLNSLSESEAEELKRKTRRIIFSDSSDESNHSDSNPPSGDEEDNDDGAKSPPPESDGKASPKQPETEPAGLDAELLAALGDTVDDAPTYGEPIQQDLAQRWLPILRKGMSKEKKESLLKEHAAPENCKLLRGPTLNAEIAAAISEPSKVRDKKLETNQNQLGSGVTAVGKGLSLLLTSEDKASKVRAIKYISEGARLLVDLHFVETQARIKMITPGLDKSFSQMIQDVERDDTLFSNKISQKIKASKIIEKQGLQIMKTQTTQKSSSTSASHSYSNSSRSRAQGNWARAPRNSATNRGGRGGAQKYPYNTRANRSTPAATSSGAKANAANNNSSKTRAQSLQ